MSMGSGPSLPRRRRPRPAPAGLAGSAAGRLSLRVASWAFCLIISMVQTFRFAIIGGLAIAVVYLMTSIVTFFKHINYRSVQISHFSIDYRRYKFDRSRYNQSIVQISLSE